MDEEARQKHEKERIKKKFQKRVAKQKIIVRDEHKMHVWSDIRLLKKLPMTLTSFGHSLDLEEIFEVESGKDLMVVIFGRKDFGGFHPIGFCSFHQLYAETIMELFDKEEYVDISINYFNINNWVCIERGGKKE